MEKLLTLMFGMFCAASSVADPDPDPVGSGLFGSPGSESGKVPDTDLDPLSTKRPLGNALVLVPITEALSGLIFL